MPMVWNAETDAKLLSAILQVYDVKISGVKLAEVAALMGPECTPKALTHRLAKFRSLAKTTDTGDDATTKPVPTGSKATKGTKGGIKKASSGQGKKKGGRTPSPNVDENGDETAGLPTPPPSGRPQRQGAKRDYAQLAEGDHDDEEDDGLDKKVKIEVGEDIGEGLRQSNDDTDEELEGAGLLS